VRAAEAGATARDDRDLAVKPKLAQAFLLAVSGEGS